VGIALKSSGDMIFNTFNVTIAQCTLLIFIKPRQINYNMCIWDQLSFESYNQSIQKMTKKKMYMINHIPIKQVWLKKSIILIKYVQNGWIKKC
jgi:hypothetical protein